MSIVKEDPEECLLQVSNIPTIKELFTIVFSLVIEKLLYTLVIVTITFYYHRVVPALYTYLKF